jgi:hypothetical protein
VPTNRWSELLAGALTEGGLGRLADTLGFGTPLPLEAATRRSIGLDVNGDGVRVAAGPGTARLLLLTSSSDLPIREQARLAATALTRRAPHLLWLLAIAVPGRAELLIAAWRARQDAPRIAAIVVNCRDVLASDAETMAALAACTDPGDVMTHGRWLEVLGREAISRRFFLALARVVGSLADGAAGRAAHADRREIALLHVSRMLFLSFLESRGILDGDHRFLARHYDRCLSSGGRYQRRLLEPLFFGTLNTPVARRAPAARALGRIPFLNGGLFTRAPVEVRCRSLVLRDEDWGVAHDALLQRYRFSAAEETAEWQEAAVDPEILGRAFESLMAARDRRLSGAYFTPLALVERTTDTAIQAYLSARGVADGTFERAAAGHRLEADEAGRLRAALGGLRLIDPACGSGAFLVHALECLTRLHLASGDDRPAARVRRDVVTRSIFGVDVNPTAVWLCELRLWLSIVIEQPESDPTRLPPLPNLDHNVRCGDTLAGGDFTLARPLAGNLGSLRARYARATGARKRALARELDRRERAGYLSWLDLRLDDLTAQRRELVVSARGRDLFGGRRGSVAGERVTLRRTRATVRGLRRVRALVQAGGALPFAFAAQFPDAADAGGFDVVVGNPPWVRIHNVPLADRERWRQEFRVCREAAWASGARAARAGAGFGAQVDLSALFVERGLRLLRPEGVLALLVPAKVWRSLAGGGVRRLLAEEANLLALEDWSEAPPVFDAAAYPSLVAARRRATRTDVPDEEPLRVAVQRGRLQVVWRMARDAVALDATPGAPWITLPPDARSAFDHLARSGVPLVESRLGSVTLGVKCGCNAAFLVRLVSVGPSGATVTDGARSGLIDHRHVRPVLRGESVRAWTARRDDERIVFPHGPDGRVLPSLPGDLRRWLIPWRTRLEARSDAGSSQPWWSLFRLEGARADRPRVVWADIGRCVQALVLSAGDPWVPLNTCYVLATPDLVDACTLAALLNSPLANAWLGAICEPARGGYRRHFAWSMARLPIPEDWSRARDLLGPLGERGMRGEPASRLELLDAVLDAYRVRHAAAAPLLTWMSTG